MPRPYRKEPQDTMGLRTLFGRLGLLLGQQNPPFIVLSTELPITYQQPTLLPTFSFLIPSYRQASFTVLSYPFQDGPSYQKARESRPYYPLFRNCTVQKG